MEKPDYKEFARAVYDIVKAVPPGRITSYGAIARAAGHPHHSRMVGRIMGRCDDPNLPAHRVTDSRGRLSGRYAFGTPHRMGDLLEAEGIPVADDRVVNPRRFFWDPLEEIRL